jgi:hypothetical protein
MTKFNYDPTIVFENKIINQEYIKKYYFMDVGYAKKDIYDIFEINNEILNRII